MARTAAASVAHLTEAELAARWKVEPSTVASLRKSGDGPRHLPLSESATKRTIRYRLADIEAWEESRLKSGAA